ncbi:ABC transporter ATP-binding protein/permease [bacterium]|nr:ABC transporter ATP-binding protein/permease [bacterium]
MHKIILLLGPAKRQLPLMLVAFLTLSLTELIGIGLLIPYVNFIVHGNFPDFGTEIETYFDFESKAQEYLLIAFSFVIILIFLLKFVLSLLMTRIINSFAQRQRVIMGLRLLNIFLNQDFLDYVKRSDADGVYEVQTVSAHFYGAIQLILRSFSDLLILISLVLLMFIVEPRVLILAIGSITFVVGGYLIVFRQHLINLGARSNKAESGVVGVCQDAFRGFRELRLLGKVDAFVKFLAGELEEAGRVNVQQGYHAIIPRHLVEFCIVVLFVAVFLVAYKSGIDSKQVTSVAVVYVLSSLRIVPLFTGITAAAARLRSLTDSINRLENLLAGSKKVSTKPVAASRVLAPKQFEALQLKNVTFSYPSEEKNVFTDLSLRIKTGETIGIMGPSGAGKTTLINVIAGFLHPKEGSVFFNSQSIFEANISDLGIGYVPQETVSINSSVLKNIILGDDDTEQNRARAMNAIDAVQLGTVVADLPDGVDTSIGQSGTRISGGQRQRIAIARTLYHKKNVIILDEATNALDEATEARLLTALRIQNKMGAIIVVSHRPSTLKFCDRVLCLDDGKLKPVVDRENFFAK